jgi:hypothetical protein
LDPICLKGKYWDIIKLDFYDFITRLWKPVVGFGGI